MKKRIQGMVTGFLAAVFLFAISVPAYAALTGRQITAFFGINLVVNGETVSITGADGNLIEPFSYNGRTFVPVAAIAEALSLPAHWDGETNTAYVGVSPDKVYRLSDFPYTENWNNPLTHCILKRITQNEPM
jgi:hypothetical protein